MGYQVCCFTLKYGWMCLQIFTMRHLSYCSSFCQNPNVYTTFTLEHSSVTLSHNSSFPPWDEENGHHVNEVTGWSYCTMHWYFTFPFVFSWLPTGCGTNCEPSEQRWRPLFFWWPTESWLRPGLPSAAARLHTISGQHLGFTWQVIHCFQWQLSPFGRPRCGGWKGRRRTRRSCECRRGVHGAWMFRRERADGARWPWDAANQTGIWSQPAGGRPGDREKQWGECAWR